MADGKKNIQHIINIVVFTICFCLLFVGNSIINSLNSTKSSMKTNIEKEWRQQAKRTLSNIKDQFMYDLTNGDVDPADEYSLQDWAKRNISGVLNGGSTGDMFMINLGNEKFIWDGSPDCAKDEFITNGRYMKDEPPLHQDPVQAQFIMDKMKLAQSTLNTYDNFWWNFDGSPEYLEWVVIPPGSLGFNSEPKTVGGIVNNKYSKLLIALGTQEDEVQSTFTNNFTDIDNMILKVELFICASITICFVNMIIFIYLNKKRVE
jgi:hypothetical protein